MITVIFENLSDDDADTYRLVLSSTGIFSHSRKGKNGWNISVNATDYENALNAIDQYLKENQNFHTAPESLWHDYQRTFTGLWVSVLLLVSHVAIVLGNESGFFIQTYGSSAYHILHGELYRSVTSLMLHADTLHIMGNIIGITIFGTAVGTLMGWGVGWFMILVTGITGNLVNALLYRSGHISVGASTAIFGAIGILSAHQFFKKFRQPGHKMKALLPLSCGLALLGILGSGKHSDLMAHLFGFCAGIISGSFYSVFVKHPASKEYQTCFLIAAIGIIVTAWMKAF
jgi:membrane associated rhomboid family serine protease